MQSSGNIRAIRCAEIHGSGSRRPLLEELPPGARLGVRQRFPLGMIMSGDT